MQVRIFTLRFNPVTESFDDSVVASFLAEKDVLSIRDYFFVKDDTPYLTLVIRLGDAYHGLLRKGVVGQKLPPLKKGDGGIWRERVCASI